MIRKNPPASTSKFLVNFYILNHAIWVAELFLYLKEILVFCKGMKGSGKNLKEKSQVRKRDFINFV